MFLLVVMALWVSNVSVLCFWDLVQASKNWRDYFRMQWYWEVVSMIYVDFRLKFNRYVDNEKGRTGSLMNKLLRSTVCRSVEFIVSLWVSHLLPLTEYCSCLWNVEYLGDIRRLESLQRRWTRKIQCLATLQSEDRSKRANFYSVFGRFLWNDLITVLKISKLLWLILN